MGSRGARSLLAAGNMLMCPIQVPVADRGSRPCPFSSERKEGADLQPCFSPLFSLKGAHRNLVTQVDLGHLKVQASVGVAARQWHVPWPGTMEKKLNLHRATRKRPEEIPGPSTAQVLYSHSFPRPPPASHPNGLKFLLSSLSLLSEPLSQPCQRAGPSLSFQPKTVPFKIPLQLTLTAVSKGRQGIAQRPSQCRPSSVKGLV